jgi:6-pyruvoyltetrahydropterin/6-carboxytetrahydropterin synthase
MFTISKSFSFSAAHQLHGLPEGHQCGRLHGHNYTLEVVLRSAQLNEHGFVLDYGKLDFVKTLIDETVEHRSLNDAFPGMQPSAELLAQQFYRMIFNIMRELEGPEIANTLHAVRVKETDKTCAEYCPYAFQ